MEIKESLSLNDVLLVPKFSPVKSRADVDVSVNMPKEFTFKMPIIPANMKHITEDAMANAIGEMGGLAILHRFSSIEDQLKVFNLCKYKNNVGCSLGIKEIDKENAVKFNEAGCRIFCVDVAHAHSEDTGKMVEYLAKTYPNNLLIVGCIATKEALSYLKDKGADVVRINIGAGSICVTRIVTGNGVPQLSALMDCYSSIADDSKKFGIIADGGMVNSGDCVKSLCFSHMIITGNMVAGVNECPNSTTLWKDGQELTPYSGSSSFKLNYIEGVPGYVPRRYISVQKVIEKIMEGIRSGCSYQGATNLFELRQNPQFVKISHAGLIESHAHDVRVL